MNKITDELFTIYCVKSKEYIANFGPAPTYYFYVPKNQEFGQQRKSC